jgi:hypothetical protein
MFNVTALAVTAMPFASDTPATAGEDVTNRDRGCEGTAVPGAMERVTGGTTPAWTVTVPRTTAALAVTCAEVDGANRISGRKAKERRLRYMVEPGMVWGHRQYPGGR